MPLLQSSAATPANYLLYVGVYGKGVYAYRYEVNGPKLESLGLVGEVTNPSFLATDRDFRYLYAASELEGRVDGAVAAFAINRKTGALKALNSESAAGQSPCHLTLDHTAKMLMVANYGTGSVSVFPVETEGRLGKMSGLMTADGASADPHRQKGPHAHQTVVSEDNRFVYVPDLGLDQIRIYRLDPANAKLTPNDPPFAKLNPGYGPRHIAFSPNGRFAYVVSELKSFVTVFSRDASTGGLTELQSVSTLPEDFKGENAPAEIEIDRAGKFVYASNRGPGTIAVFAVNSDGTLKRTQVAATGGTSPRGFTIDPTGHYLLAGDQKSNQFVVFQIDPKNGQLSLTDRVFNVPSPVDFLFVPAQ
jgi:6-phosphogluconolactonase